MSAAHQELLTPERLDTLEELAYGKTGRLLRSGDIAVKVPHPFEKFRKLVAREAATLRVLTRFSPRIPAPKLYYADQRGFVRSFIDGVCLLDLLLRAPEAIDWRVWKAVFSTYDATEAYRKEKGTTLDFTPPNLLYVPPKKELYLVDLGHRRQKSPFVGLSHDELTRALTDYAKETAAKKVRLRKFFFPPSGRFDVPVPVGRNDRAELIFKNEGALERFGLSWSDSDVLRVGDWSTENQPALDWFPASRYQDSPGRGERDARGDGRSVYAGCLSGGLYEEAEVTLKGVGPTPLRWEGMKYHFDGRVSLNRTLWETSVCDELARLGFETPEILGVVLSDSTTVDNSEIELPAAIAIRVASTHYRFGHLLRFSGEPEAFVTLWSRIGRKILGSDFKPRDREQIDAWVELFSKNLGDDIGRSECLNIVAFNPTPGNVRVDGHLLDFSTVRFFDRTLPDFRFMEMTWTVARHRFVMSKQVRRFVSTIVKGLGLSDSEHRKLTLLGLKAYEDAYVHGYLVELHRLLGLAPPPNGALSVDEMAMFSYTKELRALRDPSGRTHRLEFWKQEVAAPSFRMESALPAFVESYCNSGTARPELLVDPECGGQPSSAQIETARRFCDAFVNVAARNSEPIGPGLAWSDRVRPFMEAERLAALLYGDFSDEDLVRWKSLVSTW